MSSRPCIPQPIPPGQRALSVTSNHLWIASTTRAHISVILGRRRQPNHLPSPFLVGHFMLLIRHSLPQPWFGVRYKEKVEVLWDELFWTDPNRTAKRTSSCLLSIPRPRLWGREGGRVTLRWDPHCYKSSLTISHASNPESHVVVIVVVVEELRSSQSSLSVPPSSLLLLLSFAFTGNPVGMFDAVAV